MAAAEAGRPGQYAKLRKEEKDGDAPAGTDNEDIRPGELNQPVRVPELEVQTCQVLLCGQVLEPGFHPPADEPWNTGIFGCAEDCESCWTGLLCPCVLFGRNTQAITEVPWMGPCTCHAVCIEGGIALAILTAAFHGVTTPAVSCLIGELCGWMFCTTVTSLSREVLQEKYHLMNSPCNPWLVHCGLHWCAICQEHREIKGRLPTQHGTPATIIKPPLVQEMSMAEIPSSTTAPENEAPKTGQDNVEVVPL